jgi:hypothetical protein
MKILVVADEREMSIEAARIIGALVRTKPDASNGS